jgi:hypothetical protein
MAKKLDLSAMASKGGKKAAANMTPEERSERAKKAAASRWQKEGKGPRTAICGSPDRPIRIGDVEIPCYVLDDGLRVITQAGMLRALNMSAGGTGTRRDGDRLAKFVTGKGLLPYVSSELIERTTSPIRFRVPTGNDAYGYEATILADICNAIIAADHDNQLQRQQRHIAAQCVILVRAFTKLGIVALVDEATGYQETRERDALAQILEAFVAKELRAYMRTFDADYYKEICRLKGWEYKTSSRRPRALAHITNNLVYSRLAPGVLDELRRKNPVVKDGRRDAKHFQWLTEQKGHPDLQKHLSRITGWMEMCSTWEEFMRIMNEKKPVYRGPTLFDRVPDGNEEVDEIDSSESTPLALPSSEGKP